MSTSTPLPAPTRAALLWQRARAGSRALDYGPALTTWLRAAHAELASNHEALRRLHAAVGRLPRTGSLDPQRHALVYAVLDDELIVVQCRYHY